MSHLSSLCRPSGRPYLAPKTSRCTRQTLEPHPLLHHCNRESAVLSCKDIYREQLSASACLRFPSTPCAAQGLYRYVFSSFLVRTSSTPSRCHPVANTTLPRSHTTGGNLTLCSHSVFIGLLFITVDVQQPNLYSLSQLNLYSVNHLHLYSVNELDLYSVNQKENYACQSTEFVK